MPKASGPPQAVPKSPGSKTPTATPQPQPNALTHWRLPSSRTIANAGSATYTAHRHSQHWLWRFNLAQRQRTACGRFGVVQPCVHLDLQLAHTERFSPPPPSLQAVLADGHVTTPISARVGFAFDSVKIDNLLALRLKMFLKSSCRGPFTC